jgi:hypothetical protein
MEQRIRRSRDTKKAEPIVQPVKGVNAAPTVQLLSQATIQRLQQDPAALTADEVMILQRTLGNRAVQRLLAGRAASPSLSSQSPAATQSTLKVGPVGDRYEQEAARLANAPASGHAAKTNMVQPKLQVQRMASTAGAPVDKGTEQSIRQARGHGQQLPDPVRQSMEQRFGADFRAVKLHTGTQAQHISRSLNAKAFTTGADIFFGKNRYNPGSTEGQKLLAHELTHTMQQGGVQKANRNQAPQQASGAVAQRAPSGTGAQRARFTPSQSMLGSQMMIQREGEEEEDDDRGFGDLGVAGDLKDQLGQEKSSRTGAKWKLGLLQALDYVTMLPLHVIDQASIADLHIKDLVNYAKEGKTYAERNKGVEGAKGRAKRALGRTGLRGYAGGLKSHQVMYGDAMKKAQLPVLGSDLNPVRMLAAAKNKQRGKIKAKNKGIKDLKKQLADLA